MRSSPLYSIFARPRVRTSGGAEGALFHAQLASMKKVSRRADPAGDLLTVNLNTIKIE